MQVVYRLLSEFIQFSILRRVCTVRRAYKLKALETHPGMRLGTGGSGFGNNLGQSFQTNYHLEQ